VLPPMTTVVTLTAPSNSSKVLPLPSVSPSVIDATGVGFAIDDASILIFCPEINNSE
jgi:hypothetical protein